MDELLQIIKECAANERLSQEKLYRRFYPPLFLLCKRFFKDDHQALEALNDGMLKVYKHIGNYRLEKGVFFNWIYTIIRNTALDKVRIPNNESTLELKDNTNISYSGNPLKSMEWKDIYSLLNMLTPSTRVVCSLFYLEGFSIRDISESLHLSKGTIKWHLHEARKKLKPVLEKHYL